MSKDYSNIEGLIGNVKESIRNAYDKGYKQGVKDGNYDKEFYCNLNFEHGTNKGLDDAWKLARKLRHPSYEDTYSDDEKRDIFGYVSSDSILTNLSASEAIKKVEEYEEKQKQADDEIKVGDEVVIDDSIGIVTRAFPGAIICYVMRRDGSSGEEDRNDCKKTGRHFSQIAEVLEQLKEAQDETK